jgi:hypothetical protein
MPATHYVVLGGGLVGGLSQAGIKLEFSQS